MIVRLLILLIVFTFTGSASAQVKVLFDNTKAETAGSADWVIDADSHNLGFGSGPAVLNGGTESNAQRIPSPSQSAITTTTAETYWTGGLSNWGVDCAKRGYIVETLPYNGKITYGDTTNPQDLSNYNAYIVCEPNILFTDAEKTAVLKFVASGGGLFMISDHTQSDRNNDNHDSPEIWDDLLQNNSTGNSNPFGIIFDLQNYSGTFSNLAAALPVTDTLLHGPMGNVTKVMWSNGTTITINPTANAAAKAVIYRSGTSGNTNIAVACSRYGAGKIVAIGDSSPCDDGTGDPNDQLYNGYTGDVSTNHQNLIMNATIWLVTRDKYTYIFTGNGNWDTASNWKEAIVPPPLLPSGDSIFINNTAGGQCVLNVTQHIASGATLVVLPNKSLVIPGVLSIK